jgi:anaerobic ribonucleoside-triphosphate reductase activating protein
LKCPGCWNQETHEHGKGEQVRVDDLVDWLAELNEIEGVTFSGGEPLQQGNFPELLARIRQRLPYLSIGLFTGYALEELLWENWRPLPVYLPVVGFPDFFHAHPDWWERIRENLDFAVMGRYNQRLKTTEQPLCGSSNQKVHLFSTFYKESDFNQQEVEVIVASNGKLVTITGFPSAGMAEGLQYELEA